jgi:hypothetical protein
LGHIVKAYILYVLFIYLLFILFYFIFYNVVVLFGAHESASCGVKIKSILFQDSVQFSGLVVSAMFDFNKFFNFIKLSFLPWLSYS